MHRAEQRLEEHAAVKTDAEELRIEIAVAQIEHAPPGRGRRDERVDARSLREDRPRAPEPLEHEQPGRLHHDARPDRPRLADALEEGHLVPRPREKNPRRGARRAQPYDRDAHEKKREQEDQEDQEEFL